MATIASMIYSIEAQTASIEKSMVDVTTLVEGMEKSMVKATEATGGWSSILDSLGGSFVARVAEGVLLRDAVHELLGAMKDTIEALPDLIEHTIAVGNSLFEMAVKTGSSVEGLSALRYVASQTGIDFNSFGTTLSMMEKNLGATGKAGEKVGEVLASMGLDLATVKSLRSDEAFTTIAQSLFAVGNNADKAHDAAILMGKGAKEMAVLWHEDIGPMIDEAKDLGLIMSTETAAGAHLAEIGFQSLHMQMEALGMHIATAFLPAIIGIEGDLQTGLTEAVKTLNAQLGATGGSGGALALVAQAMGRGDLAIKAQTQLYEDLKAVLLGVVRNSLEPLITTIGFVMTEFNAAKVVIGDVIQVFEILNLQAAKFELFKASSTDVWGNNKAQIQSLQTAIDDMTASILKRGAALEHDKSAEADWSSWAVNANKAVEVALNAIGAAHTDVGKKMKEMGDVSRAAYGMASDGIDDVGAGMKAFKAAVIDVNSAGVGWKGTLDTIDGSIIDQVRDLTAAGVSMKTLETYFGFTATVGKAFTEMLKDEATQLKLNEGIAAESEKLWDKYYKTVNAASHDTLQTKINDLALGAATLEATLAKEHKLTTDTRNAIEAERDQAQANLLQKDLESDVHTRSHFQLVADQAKIAYDKAVAAGSEYTSEWILQLQKTADAAKLAADTFGLSFNVALKKVDDHLAVTIDGFHQLAMASAAAALSGAGDPGQLDKFTHMTASETAAVTAGQWVDLSQVAARWNAMSPAARAAVESRDVGGAVNAGQSYLIGTGAQPELFTPASAGTMTPNGGGATTTVNVNLSGAIATDRASFKRIVKAIFMEVVQLNRQLPS